MDWLIVALAGFLGGMLNAVAGGGSFLTLPALIYVGVPPIAANATGTAALLPGYMASAWRFRKDIEFPAGLGMSGVIGISIVGGGLGAAVLLVSSDQLFASLIPWLILFATVAFIIGPRLINRRASSADAGGPVDSPTEQSALTVTLVLFAVCAYGGYFNGGLGIILLAALGLLGQTNLHGMNGFKNLVSALLTTVAVVVYALGDTIWVSHLLVAGTAAILGGYLGAAVAY
ncbi:MAG: sulfite exporter TauE/SafE family protein, partial [Gammaproteobacteria bacterium]